jgi:hypothetical protein
MRPVSAKYECGDGRSLWQGRSPRILLVTVFFCRTLAVAGAPAPGSVQTVRDDCNIRLPVVDQQDIRFNRVSPADGQSQLTTVTAMVEDDHGFVWLGTRYGLNRYDVKSHLPRRKEREPSDADFRSV